MADEDIEEKDDSTLTRKLNDILKAKGRAGDADGVKDHHRQKRKLHTPLKKWNKARIYYQISSKASLVALENSLNVLLQTKTPMGY